MKHQVLFSSKSKELKSRLLQFLFDTLRVKGKNSLIGDLLLLEVSSILKGDRNENGRVAFPERVTIHHKCYERP